MKRFVYILLFCATTIEANIPATVTERDEYCKKYLEQAAFADMSYKKKIAIYDKLLPLITFGISDTVEQEYLTALEKLFHARDRKNSDNNLLLEKLLARSSGTQQLNNEQSGIQTWLEKISYENRNHALTSKKIIALYLPHAHGYLHPKKEAGSLKLHAEPFSNDAPANPPSILFSFEEEKEKVLENGSMYSLKPLYFQNDAYSFPISSNETFAVIFKKDTSYIKNLYDKDHVKLLFKEKSENSSLHEAWAKVELISQEQMNLIENNYFAQKIQNAHIDNKPIESMKIIGDHLELFNERITRSHKELVMKKLQILVDKHEDLPLCEQQQLRQLCAQAIQKLPSSPEKKECKQYLATINKTLEPKSLNFDDTIALSSDHGTLLCTKYNPHSETEPLAIHERQKQTISPNHAIQYMKIASPSDKKGIIRYGDEISMVPLYKSTNGTIAMLNLTNGLARRQKEHRGSTLSYLGCAPISHAMPGIQKTTFQLCPPKEFSYLQKNGSCYTPEDPCLLMHQASREYINHDKNAPPLQQYTFNTKGSILSYLKPSTAELAQINESLINQEYSAYKNQKTATNKIVKLKKMSDLFIKHETNNAYTKVWQVFNDLFQQKESLSSQELVKLHTHLKKVAPHLTKIEHYTKKELLIHSAFYTKLRLAGEQNGALRLAAYQSLLPYLKHQSINVQYKKELLSQINNLYERKTTELNSLHDLVDLATTKTTEKFDIEA